MNKSTNEVMAILSNRIGYSVKDEKAFLEALTHTSFANEMKINRRNHYERLEFLGDAVLELIMSEYLYNKYPNESEGNMSKKRASIVCEKSLSACARKMGLGELLFLGKGEDLAGGREKESILCDITESVLGAIYLESGIMAAKEYVYTNIINVIDEEEGFVDAKSAFQECVRALNPKAEIVYDILEEKGPDHDKIFVAGLFVDGKMISKAEGHNKKDAHQKAAMLALKEYKQL